MCTEHLHVRIKVCPKPLTSEVYLIGNIQHCARGHPGVLCSQTEVDCWRFTVNRLQELLS